MPIKADLLRRSSFLFLLLACGFIAGKALKAKDAPPAPAAVSKLPPAPRRFTHAATPGEARAAAQIDLRSTDNLADLLNLAPEDLYDRLALWLVDAGADDIAAYWTATKNQENLPKKIRKLLFIRWTLLDPLGAIHAAAGTPFSHIPWWAWARNAPSAAFEHALAHDRSQIDTILCAISESDPKHALKLLRDHPELPSNTGLDGILLGLTRDDPEAAVKLASESNEYMDTGPMKAWLRADPHAAFDWYLADRSLTSFNMDKEVVKTLASENPELLDEFASKLPHGDFRRQIEAAAFEYLVRKDPDKALEQARKTPSPTISAGQRSQIALHLLDSDPQQAKSLFAESLALRPDFLFRETKTVSQNGINTASVAESADPLLRRLVAADPQGTLQQLIAANPSDSMSPAAIKDPLLSGPMNHTTRQAALQWAESDPDAFAAWSATLTQASLRNQSYELLISKLKDSREFESAMHYAKNLDDSARRGQIGQILGQWRQSNPAAAAAWIEANGIEIEKP